MSEYSGKHHGWIPKNIPVRKPYINWWVFVVDKKSILTIINLYDSYFRLHNNNPLDNTKHVKHALTSNELHNGV
jgi:hypothetical protein